MKKISLVAVLVLLVASTLPLLAGGHEGKATMKAKEATAMAEGKVKLTGWITDEYCGKNNANAKGKDCAIACAKKGAQLVLYSNEKIYKLSDQELALKHVGHEVVVFGMLGEDGTIEVAKVKEKKAKA